MNRAEVLAELREVLGDKVAPYAWSDLRLLNFLSLGQDQFCKDTGFFRDSQTYKINTVAGTEAYSIPGRVIEILQVRIDGNLLRKFTGDAPAGASEGIPFAWRTDDETGLISFYPTPDAVYQASLRVWRKSKISFSTSGDLEIPEDFHLAPVEWAAHLALSDHDRELQDPVKAADHKAKFDRHYVPEGKRAFRRICAGSGLFSPNPLYLV